MKPPKGLEEFTWEELKEMTLGDDADAVVDEDNPEWTAERMARARPASELPQDVLNALPKTLARVRGPQRAPVKVAVSLRLNAEVVEHFRADGPGWQTRINDALSDLIKRTG